MSDETPPRKNRTPPEHASPRARTPGLSSIAARGWRIWRCHSVPRFESSTEQLRLVLLGTILMCFAVLALMDPVLDAPIPGYVEGFPALFGGIALCVAILRLGRSGSHLDWIVVGLLYVALGMLLSANPMLQTTLGFLAFCLLLFAIVSIRVSILLALGMSDKAALWPLVTALWGTFCILVMVIARVLGMNVVPDLILGLDLMVAGFATVGFAKALRERTR